MKKYIVKISETAGQDLENIISYLRYKFERWIINRIYTVVNITVFFYTIETILEELSNKKVGENTANSIFKREDFPSVNIGKTKTVTLNSYLIWKSERRE